MSDTDWSASRVRTRRGMPVSRMVSTITGGTSPRPRVSPPSSASAQSWRSTMTIACCAPSATAARTRSTMLVRKSSAGS